MELFRANIANGEANEDEDPPPQEVIFIDRRSTNQRKSKTTRLELDPKCLPPCRTITITREDDRLKIYAHGHMKDLGKNLELSFPEELTELEVILTPTVTVISSELEDKSKLDSKNKNNALDCSTNLSDRTKMKIKCDLRNYLLTCRTIVISKETRSVKIYGHGHSKKVEHNIAALIHQDIGLKEVKVILTPKRTGR